MHENDSNNRYSRHGVPSNHQLNNIIRMKTIVIGIDFSRTSIIALKYAIMIAQKVGASIMMVNVVKQKDYESTLKKSDGIEPGEIEKNLIELCNTYGKDVPGGLEYRIRDGKVFKEISNQARYSDAWLIVAGAHGLSGFEELWIGNNAYRIVSQSSCPVISIRKGECSSHLPERIVLPLDSTPETIQKIPFTIELARLFQSELHIISLYSSRIPNVKTQVGRSTQMAVDMIKEKNVPFKTIELEADNLTVATLEYVKKINAGMVSIMTEQEFSPKNVLLGPYAQQMINQSPVPVLSFKTKVYQDTDETGLF